MERQRRAMEEIAEQRHDHEDGGDIVLSDSDKEVTAPSKPICSGDPGKGCSMDAPKNKPSSDIDDDDGSDDYTVFYNLLGMK
ncbi:hypothetical protein D1007_40832 [Hordeum vulgare]|nr:hypothetical protein D1007_40832 [Hordeum vulgare]